MMIGMEIKMRKRQRVVVQKLRHREHVQKLVH